MPKRLAGVVVATSMLAWAAIMPAAGAATPKCHGVKATIVRGSSADTIEGTKGADVIVAGGGDDLVFAKGGNDIICGGAGADTLNGQGGNDKVFGDKDGDYLYPGPGNDRVVGGPDADIVDFFYAPVGVTVDLVAGRASGEGNDTLASLEGVGGSEFDDRLTGSDVNETFQGGAGNDVINSGGNVDVMAGGPGDDSIDGGDGVDLLVYLFSSGPVQVDLRNGTASGDGNDTFTGIEGASDSPFNDSIVGDDQGNLFLGGPGDDKVDGGGGFDYALYWLADQPMDINLASHKATGYGNDSLTNIEGAWGSLINTNRITGDGNNNALLGGLMNDELLGGSGDDLLQGYLGDDIYDGGSGTFDGAIFTGFGTGVQADLVAGTAAGEGSDTLKGIEALQGTPFSDVFIGSSAGNVMYGAAGDDQLTGNGGADFLSGDDGADNADGGEGNDNCSLTESVASCEGTAGPPVHPLTQSVAVIVEVQRTFNF
ncbi:MAG: hypothetical protein QOK47_235 [Actinomycetota bacterium]|nr:hypothetical protein [Actinomycetota bacterium]